MALVFTISLIVSLSLVLIGSLLVAENIYAASYTTQNKTILNQIIANLDSFHQKTTSAIIAYQRNTSLAEFCTNENLSYQDIFRIYNNLQQHHRQFNSTDPLPSHMDILGKNGKFITFFQEKVVYSPEQLSNHPITLQSQQDPRKLFYLYNDEGFSQNTKDTPVIIATKQLFDSKNNNYGTIFITTTEKEFATQYEQIIFEGSNLMILSNQGQIMSSNKKDLVGNVDQDLLDAAKNSIETGENYYKINGSSLILISTYLPTYDMYMVNTLDRYFLMRQYLSHQSGTVLIFFFSLVITLIPVALITRRITEPLTNLTKQMKKSEKGAPEKIKLIRGSYETKELQMVYNSMVDQINSYTKKLVEEEAQRRKLEIKTLQMQINPHFLYNTLASIKYLIWQEEPTAASNTMNALILLLQNTIGISDEHITIERELENLKQYVAINHIRYGTDIKVSYFIDDDCLTTVVPKLILQPFIENAFFHAYQKKKSGHIRVFARRNENDLIIEIIDDGDGMDISSNQDNKPQKPKEKKHFTGIGINNVDERLKLLYGEKYGVKIESRIGVGTSVTLLLKQ